MAEVTKFKFGNTYPDDLYVGNSLVDRVYYGSELVYGFAPPIQIELVEVISFQNNSVAVVPNYVDDTHFGVLLELAAGSVFTSTPPSGWTLFAQQTTPSFKLYGSYKILSISDRGTSVSFKDGSAADYDQLYIFKSVTDSVIKSIFGGDFSVGMGTNITITAPILNPDQSAASFHYFYSSSTFPTTTSNPASDQTIYHTYLDYAGSQYKIVNGPNIPTNTEYGVADGISQLAFWIIVE